MVRLRRPPEALWPDGRGATPNHLRFELSPDIAISRGAPVKMPGEKMIGTEVELAMLQQPCPEAITPYERLLGDAMSGDPSLCARQDAVETAREVVDPVLDDASPLYSYEPGSWGPSEAKRLTIRHGGWHHPNPRGPAA